jgi:hypothetical protein
MARRRIDLRGAMLEERLHERRADAPAGACHECHRVLDLHTFISFTISLSVDRTVQIDWQKNLVT